MTRPRLQVVLTAEEDRTLLELSSASSVPQRTKERAQVLRLNHRGWTTEGIADYLNWQVETVRQAIYRWQQKGLSGLWDAPRGGRPPKWSEADIAQLEQSLQQENQTSNAQQLAHQLQQERQVSLSRWQLRRILKKRAIAGSALGIVIETCKTR